VGGVGGVGVTLNIDPNQPGNNTFETYLTGNVGSVERVRLLFDEQKKGAFQSELVLDQSPTTPLYFVGSGAFINEGGKWKVTVDLRRGAGSTSDLSVAYDVAVTGASVTASDRSGSALDSPRAFSTATIAFLVASGLLCVALVVASLDKPDRPAGLMGDFADRVAGFEMRPGISLAALVVAGIGLGILVGTHTHTRLTGSQATQGNPVKSSPASIEKGQALFQQNCTQCHGESGRGDGPLAPSLRLPPANLYDHIPYHPDQFFFDIITNGAQGVMPSFADTLSSDDRWNILNYLRSRFAQPPAAQ
jgi:cytochrome c553